MDEVGKIVYERTLKKSSVGIDPKQLATILMDEKIRHFINLEKEGKTDKGYEMNVITIYSKPWEALKGGK